MEAVYFLDLVEEDEPASPPCTLPTLTGDQEILKEFIQNLQALPELWDTSYKDYKNVIKRGEALQKLQEIYKKMKSDATINDVKKKINILRSNYRKELRRIHSSQRSAASDDDVYKPKSWIFHLMHFINKTEHPITQQASQMSNGRDSPTSNRNDSDQDTLTMNNSDSEQDTPNRSVSERAIPMSSRSRPRPSKTKITKEILKFVNEDVKRPKLSDNRFEVFGKNVGMKLQELPNLQRIIAEKIINETLFLAEMGSLTTSHAVKAFDLTDTTFSIQPYTGNITSEPNSKDLSTQPHT